MREIRTGANDTTGNQKVRCSPWVEGRILTCCSIRLAVLSPTLPSLAQGPASELCPPWRASEMAIVCYASFNAAFVFRISIPALDGISSEDGG